MRILLAVLLGCTIPAGFAKAQVDGLCDKVLLEYEASPQDGVSPATKFVHEKTKLLDIMYGDPSAIDENAPYRALYAIDGKAAKEEIDFFTNEAVLHDGGCVEVKGTLKQRLIVGADRKYTGDVTLDDVPNQDDPPMPVSVFAFDRAEFSTMAKPGPRDQTNVRVKVGKLVLKAGEDPDVADPIGQFGLSTYIDDKRTEKNFVGSVDATRKLSSKGEHRWLVMDIGVGRQLVAIACSPSCSTYLQAASSAQAGASTGKPSVPDATAAAEQPASRVDFAGERIEIRGDGAFETIDLEERTKAFSDEERQSVRGHLDALGGDTADGGPDRALQGLIEDGVLPREYDQWSLQESKKSYELTLERKRSAALTRVELELEEPQGSNVLQTCTPKVEILHPKHAPMVRKFELDPASKIGGKYGRFVLDLDANQPILEERLETLSIRAFVDDGSGESEPSCGLTWNGQFPEKSFPLAEASSAASASVSVTEEGKAVFSNVVLSSTQRPVYLILYNIRGPEDSNGAPTAAANYPEWNAELQGQDLQEALGILATSAHDAFKRDSGGVFTVLAGGGNRRAFEPAAPLTADRVRSLSVPSPAGYIGPDSLKVAIDTAIESHDVMPRFVVIGRTGLQEGTSYCEIAPAEPAAALEDMILIDFVPEAAVEKLPEQTRTAMEEPQGSDDEFRSAIKGFPAALCPADDSGGIEHWVLLPDSKSVISWRNNLRTLGQVIFEVEQ